METEVLIGIIAVFTSGAGIGVGTTLLTQWTHKKLVWHPPQQPQLPSHHLADLQGDVDDLSRAVLDLNERLEFQERLVPAEARVPSKQPAP